MAAELLVVHLKIRNTGPTNRKFQCHPLPPPPTPGRTPLRFSRRAILHRFRLAFGASSDAAEHQFLRHQFRTGIDLAPVHPSVQTQPSANRHRSLSTLTTDCHLKHPTVHQTTALVVLTMIRFLAYTCPWSPTTAKSTATPAENARPFMSAPNA